MLNSTLWCRVGLTAVAFLLLGSRAYADIGLPMIFLALPAMLIAFIPVVLLEGFVIHKTLDLKFTRVSVVSTVSNLVSTIIGIPVTWIILVIMEMVIAGGRGYGYETLTDKFMTAVAQAPWLVPYEDQYGWMIPTAFLVLLIPFFVMSYYVEYYVSIKMLDQDSKPPARIKKAIWRANLASYAFLVLFPIVGLIIGVYHT